MPLVSLQDVLQNLRGHFFTCLQVSHNCIILAQLIKHYVGNVEHLKQTHCIECQCLQSWLKVARYTTCYRPLLTFEADPGIIFVVVLGQLFGRDLQEPSVHSRKVWVGVGQSDPVHEGPANTQCHLCSPWTVKNVTFSAIPFRRAVYILWTA